MILLDICHHNDRWKYPAGRRGLQQVVMIPIGKYITFWINPVLDYIETQNISTLQQINGLLSDPQGSSSGHRRYPISNCVWIGFIISLRYIVTDPSSVAVPRYGLGIPPPIIDHKLQLYGFQLRSMYIDNIQYYIPHSSKSTNHK